MFGIQKNPRDHFPVIVEYFILIAIVLVIIHTIVEEVSLIYFWNHQRNIQITIAGFLFDAFFSLEFVARSIVSIRRDEFRRYFFSERGWIDMLTSLPLLLLVSGPAMVYHLMGSDAAGSALEFLHILKTAKAIRVTRVLRLIRVIKLFGKIQNTESLMTNRHVGIVSTIGVVSLILVLVISQFIPMMHMGDHTHYLQQRVEKISPLFLRLQGKSPDEKWVVSYLTNSGEAEDIIRIQTDDGRLVYENPEKSELSWTAYRKDVSLGSGYKALLSYHRADAEHAKLNIIILTAVLILITAFVIFYTRIFAQQVADPIFIMDKGIRQWDYNLEVKIFPYYREEEIFSLARAYNVRWLALKNQIRRHRSASGETERSVLKMDDIL